MSGIGSVNSNGSSLDVASIVEQLMEVERQSLHKLQANDTILKAQISAYGSLKSTVSDFESQMKNLSTYSKFEIYTATSSDETTFTATTTHDASTGSHDIVVNTLAAAHKLGSKDFSDATSAIGTSGTIRITIDSDSFDVTVNTTDTLTDIRNTINNATDNTGVKATLLTVDSGTKLVLTSTETGASNAMSISNQGGTAADDLDITNTLTAAADAQITIDGLTVTRASNNISNAIQGVTINILKTNASSVNLETKKDITAVTSNVQNFVDTYNKLIDAVNGWSKGDLQGDSTLFHMHSGLQTTITKVSSNKGIYSVLAEVGIGTDTVDGKASKHLALDTAVLEEKLTSNFPDVADLFADNTDGFAKHFENIADQYLSADGLIDGRTDGLNKRLRNNQDRIDRENDRLTHKRDQLTLQFASLDATISKLSGTNDFIANSLATIPIIGANKK